MNNAIAVPALLSVLALGAAGCSSSLSGPADPDEVVIGLHITGGLAGIDERIEIDGDDRVVDPANPAFALTALQWQDLIDEIFESGLPQLGERDFGTECCDFFEFEITYDDGEYSARVSGDDNTLPPAIAAVAQRIRLMQEGVVTALVRPGVTHGAGAASVAQSSDVAPPPALDVDSVVVSGIYLDAAVEYSGGCEAHGVDLIFDGSWRESFPVQTTAWLTHFDPGDLCDARPHEVRRFDLSRFFEAYRASYPGSPAGTPISVSLTSPGDSTVHTIEVLLP